MPVNFDTSKLSEEQLATYNMQQSLMKQQEAGNQMQLFTQHQIEQQKRRFEMLSNTMKAMSDTDANTRNNLK
ncbi:MAG: hypothetical protein ABIP06_08820 [Pyrinomonadaceae bacterium]